MDTILKTSTNEFPGMTPEFVVPGNCLICLFLSCLTVHYDEKVKNHYFLETPKTAILLKIREYHGFYLLYFLKSAFIMVALKGS